MNGEETAAPAPGPATNLLQSATRLGGTLLAVVQTRVELLTTEISEDVERGVRILLWGLVAVLAAVLALLLVGVTLLIYFWDTHRMLAAVGVTAAFIVLSAVAAAVAQARLNEKPKLLDATRTELRRDVASLRGDQ